jgi:hypothetical protein
VQMKADPCKKRRIEGAHLAKDSFLASGLASGHFLVRADGHSE